MSVLVGWNGSVSKFSMAEHSVGSSKWLRRKIEFVIISNDSTTSTGHEVGLSNSARNHNRPTNAKDGQQQLSEAAAALRKALRGAADARHGKTGTEFEGNYPTVVDTNGSIKESSHRSRSKAIGVRAEEQGEAVMFRSSE